MKTLEHILLWIAIGVYVAGEVLGELWDAFQEALQLLEGENDR